MAQSPSPDLAETPVGYAFPPVPVDLSAERVEAYMRVIEGGETQSRDGEALVPPSAIATMAVSALLQMIALPPGTLHISQEVRVHAGLPVGTQTVCTSTLANRSFKAGIAFATLDFSLTSVADGAVVMDGSATLLLGKG